MTIIDTTLYLDGQLRLARHGAGKGGTVLTHVASGEQAHINPDFDAAVEQELLALSKGEQSARAIFDDLKVMDDTFAS